MQTMQPIRIAVTDRLDDGCQDLIRNVAACIEVADVSTWMAAEYAGDRTDRSQLDQVLARCEIAYGHIMQWI